MSPIGLVLNLLLGGLLVAGLALGLRLDRRLRLLRDSQQGFIRAVAELDRSTERTEAGLNQLRSAADETRDALSDRLDKAAAMVAKLERAILLAQNAVEAADAAPITLRALAPKAEAPPAEPTRRAAALGRAAEAPIAPRRSEPREPPRSRAAVDDDLFEAPPTARTGLGIRR